MAKPEYSVVFNEKLSAAVESGRLADPASIFADPRLAGASDATKKSQLKKFISDNLTFAASVEGVLPKADVILDLTERENGSAYL